MRMFRYYIFIPLLMAFLVGCNEDDVFDPLAGNGGIAEIKNDHYQDDSLQARVRTRRPIFSPGDTLSLLGRYQQKNLHFEFPYKIPEEEYDEYEIPNLTQQDIIDSAWIHGEVKGDSIANVQDWCLWSAGSWGWGLRFCFWPLYRKLVFVGSFSFSSSPIYYIDVISDLYIDYHYYGMGYDFDYWGRWASVSDWFAFPCNELHTFQVFGDHYLHDYQDVCGNKPEYWWPHTSSSFEF